MSDNNLEKANQALGSRFSDLQLLELALTHRSQGHKNNERLEFLGDSILNFLIAEDLFRRFPNVQEGKLSRLRALLVRRQTLADLGRELNLGTYLLLGTGELKSGGFNRDSILADAVEAVIGALFLDQGYSAAKLAIADWFGERLAELSPTESQKDAKSRLQEFLQGKQAPLPEYLIINIEGKSHQQTFTVECSTQLLSEPVRGEGPSRRIAEQNAAEVVLRQLKLPS